MSIITDIIKSEGIKFKVYGPGDINNLFPFLREAVDGGNTGLSFISDDQPYILIENGLPLAEMRFTAAHELAHILLGHVNNGDKSRAITEADAHLEANIFASVMMAFAYVLERVEAKAREVLD